METLPKYVLTIDVEDYFQVEAFAGTVSRSEWDTYPSRVVENTHRCLDLCDDFGVKATYFMLGWVADKYPSLVRDIHSRGHELACHSFWHRPVFSLTPEQFRQDVRDARAAIEQAAGVTLQGYRAPSWSITAKSLWALDVLVEEGFTYDSSIFPIRHDLYGIPGAHRFPYTIDTRSGKLMEYPPATIQLGGMNLPAGGGGYLRVLPFQYTKWALKRLERDSGGTIVMYFHPWELDPEQPRIAGRLKSPVRHYTNLGEMEARLRHLLGGHRFEPFCSLVTT